MVLPKTLQATPIPLMMKRQRLADLETPQRLALGTFDMEHQKTGLWCWAACTVSLAKHYGLKGMTQGKVVNDILGVTEDCSVDPVPGPCNTTGSLYKALTHYDLLENAIGGAANDAQIDASLDQGRAVAVEIAWDDGGGHYVAICGRSQVDDMLLIGDSLYGPSIRSAEWFPSRYREVGIWLNTYFTRPPKGS